MDNSLIAFHITRIPAIYPNDANFPSFKRCCRRVGCMEWSVASFACGVYTDTRGLEMIYSTTLYLCWDHSIEIMKPRWNADEVTNNDAN